MDLENAIEQEKVFIIADLHLYKKDKPKFGEDWRDYWIEEINSKVKEDDWLIINGDLVDTENKEKDTKIIKKFLSRLNTKNTVLILGNNEILKEKEYYKIGFKIVSTRIDTNRFVISHIPLMMNTKINVHGHIHGSKRYPLTDGNKHIDTHWSLHDKKILRLKDYMNLYRTGFYKGDMLPSSKMSKKEKKDKKWIKKLYNGNKYE